MAEKEKISPPKINFTTFVLSMGQATLIALGEAQDPQTGTCQTCVENAQQNIDLLAMIQDKTKGNLTVQEDRILQEMLYDLRMKYVQKKG